MRKISAPQSGISRAEFLRLVASLGVWSTASALLEACSGLRATPPAPSPTYTTVPTIVASPAPLSSVPPAPLPTPQPPPTEPAGLARVAFVNTNDRLEGVRKAIDLLGINPVEGKSVFVKANYNSSDPPPASTHLDILRALVGKLHEMGAGQITLGDRSGMGNTRQVLENVGVFSLANELGFQALGFDELQTPQDWVPFNPSGSHWSQGFFLARPCLEAGAVVQTCCLKTHQYGGHFTMSLKNSIGLVARTVPDNSHNFMTELHSSDYQRQMIAEVNQAYVPALIVLDGVNAFTSGGPASGTLVSPEVILAGTDRVAIDAVGVALLRYFGVQGVVAKGAIFKQAQISRAVELGLGVASPDQIEFITGDEPSAAYVQKIKQVLTQP
jgi:uncharacterized protein (DUF362 family)